MKFSNFVLLVLLCFLHDDKVADLYVTNQSINVALSSAVKTQAFDVVSWQAGRHILIVGDSEACAVGTYVKDVVKQINSSANQPEDIVDIECKVGTTVPYWTAGKFHAALDKHPLSDTVLIFLGTNHYWNQRDTPDVTPILSTVSERGLNCVWVGNTAVNGKHWNINNLLRFAVTPRCDYFDTEAAGISLVDGVHPSKSATIKWIKEVWKLIPVRYEENDE